MSQNPASRRRIGQQLPTPPRRGKTPPPSPAPAPPAAPTPAPADNPPP